MGLWNKASSAPVAESLGSIFSSLMELLTTPDTLDPA
jgi:hypothetical protein